MHNGTSRERGLAPPPPCHGIFPNSRAGHAAGLAWAAEFGPADRWGIEGASGLGRQLAEFLEIHDQARAHGHTRREAMRVLKRHLSNAIYRTMLRDARRSGGLT